MGDDKTMLCHRRPTPDGRSARPPRPAMMIEYRRRLLAEFRTTGARRVRDELVATYLPLARSIAGRYQGRGVPVEDLCQVASIGLIMAIDRFDASQGATFETYLWPTIVGEIKRYFRDCAWHVKVPRRRQKLAASIREAEERLARQTGRPPSISEIAGDLNVEEEEVLAAMELQHAYAPASLEQRLSPVFPYASLRAKTEKGTLDRALDAVELRTALRQALAHLDERQQQILDRRYFADETQRQVARDMGLSQMQVSRLERRALRQLREMLDLRQE